MDPNPTLIPHIPSYAFAAQVCLSISRTMSKVVTCHLALTFHRPSPQALIQSPGPAAYNVSGSGSGLGKLSLTASLTLPLLADCCSCCDCTACRLLLPAPLQCPP
jgi:hypothetical protein